MSQKRQSGSAGEDEILIRTLAMTLPVRFGIEPHAHDWGQFVYATSGVMTVRAAHQEWLVPTLRAVWIPAGVEHAIECAGQVRLRTLYFPTGVAEELPGECFVIAVSALLRELVVRAVEVGPLRGNDARHVALVELILDEIRRADVEPLELPTPLDERARVVAERVRRDPGDGASLSELARGCGASARTIERLFVRETGMTFGRWRQQARLMHAMQRLADGATVAEAGMDAGYESASAFIAAFKKSLGTTPGEHRALNRAGRGS